MQAVHDCAAKVGAIVEKIGCSPDKLIPVLQEAQSEYGYLPVPVMEEVARLLSVTESSVYGVATFYSYFTLEPKGKNIIRVCEGTACHVRKSAEILDVLEKQLGLSHTKKTTDDMMFTLETVACLGACGLSPVCVVNDEVHGAVTKEKMLAIIGALREKEDVSI